jgi:tRNA threonylcarbamoyladenosine biosynthesis protein TsaE
MNFNLTEIAQIAVMVLEKAEECQNSDQATVIAFTGNLGAGKTTLIKEIGHQLGVLHDMQSPTFSIYKKYPLEKPLYTHYVRTDFRSERKSPDASGVDPLLNEERVAPSGAGRGWKYLIHGDMYRLDSADDIRKLGWDSLVSDPENLICIEWPEKIVGAVPDDALRVNLDYGVGEVRVIDFV